MWRLAKENSFGNETTPKSYFHAPECTADSASGAGEGDAGG